MAFDLRTQLLWRFTLPVRAVVVAMGDVDFRRRANPRPKPKTERHRGNERTIPLFEELRSYLEDARDLADDPAETIIVRYHVGANLRTQLERIIGRAG
jgi:hypothetical protein